MRKPLHLIIEGTDKTGKSTVCKLLAKELNLPVIKMQSMPEFIQSGFAENASKVFNETIVQFAEHSFILDRGYPSSIVYAEYFNRQYDLKYLNDIITKLRSRIYVLDVAPRIDDDILKPTDQTNIRSVYKKYSDLLGWTIIDCTKLTPEELCQKILNDLKTKNLL